MWDEGKLRMWYHCQSGGYLNCYAESPDGIHWSKPNLGICEYKGSKENNLFLSVAPPEEKPKWRASGLLHNASIIKRPWEKDPQKRYVLFGYGVDRRFARCAYSPDGLHWTFEAATMEKGLFPSGDVLNFFFDPYAKRYVATRKMGNRRGRAAGLAVSKDGLDWELPTKLPVMVADDNDPDATQIYGMPVFPYQGMYIGLPWVYNARWFKEGTYSDQRMYNTELGSPCTVDVQIAWSWDLQNWTRPTERRPFIPRGAEGEFDSYMIYTARAPVQVGDEMYFYYGGWNAPHNFSTDKTRKWDVQAHIGLAMLRLDGFCSMRAGNREGWLITRRERITRPEVRINAKVQSGGYVLAEILDRNDNRIPGFSRGDCIPFKGDSVRHVLKWQKTDFDDPTLSGDKKFRFVLRDADLYSYVPEEFAGKAK
jgi:hypothetical protein